MIDFVGRVFVGNSANRIFCIRVINSIDLLFRTGNNIFNKAVFIEGE